MGLQDNLINIFIMFIANENNRVGRARHLPKKSRSKAAFLENIYFFGVFLWYLDFPEP
jgi:hypothetical protein